MARANKISIAGAFMDQNEEAMDIEETTSYVSRFDQWDKFSILI